MSLARGRAVADAVLLEGYALYPYRPKATKNRYRFTFGVLAPRSWSEAGGCEAWWLESQFLVEGPRPSEPGIPTLGQLTGKLRFLQVQRRKVEAVGPHGATFMPVEALDLGDRVLAPWDEGLVQEIDVSWSLESLLRHEQVSGFAVPAGHQDEPVWGPAGELAGRVVRDRRLLRGVVRASAAPVAPTVAGGEAPRGSLYRVRVRIENHTPWGDLGARREAVMSGSLASTHLLLAAHDVGFLSSMDPPPYAEAAARACRSVRTWPALLGGAPRRDLLFSSPIILHDDAMVAPESPGDLFDACEIDELLTLRTGLLTDEEKREARGCDDRVRTLLERVEGLTPRDLERLHGTFRDLKSGEMVPKPTPTAKSALAPGARVRLLPGARRTDAQDVLLLGQVATIERVEQDLEGRDVVAVTLDDDPAAELCRWRGVFRYFYLDEVEPLSPTAGAEEARA